MAEPISEDSILDLLKDDSKFSARIATLTKAKEAADQSKKELAELRATVGKFKAETDNYVNGRKAELSQQQLEHDKAATEAATRIQLGRDQMAEVLRIKTENEARDRALSAKELDLKAREKAIADDRAALVILKGSIDKAADLVRRQQDHMARLPKA